MFSSQISMSSAAQFCITWSSYKNCISKGFSRFQQDGEFVDMTLAAEGHLVKVHQNIIALASPYLKAMIQSASCQHPVVFLNNITQEMLSFILEYIYTGEVKIPKDLTPAFIEVCKALHVNGVENLYLPTAPEKESQPIGVDLAVERLTEPPPENNFAAHITINSDNFNLEVIPNANNIIQHQTQPVISIDNDFMNYQVLTDANVVENENNNCGGTFPPPTNIQTIFPLTDIDPPISQIIDEEENRSITSLNSDFDTTNQKLKSKENLSAHRTDKIIPPSIGDRDKAHHYSISNRGSMQLLMNRYMYYCHHSAFGGRKRRWRCVDYRKLRCPAIIDTDNEDIINRSEVHSHSNHDTKILRKFKSKQIYTSLAQAEDRVAEKPSRIKGKKKITRKTR